MSDKAQTSGTTQVAVRVPNDLLAFLDAKAASQEVPTSRAAVIIKALKEYQERSGGKSPLAKPKRYAQG